MTHEIPKVNSISKISFKKESNISQMMTSNRSDSQTPKLPLDIKGHSPRSNDVLMSQYKIKLAFHDQKTENKNSGFRRESSIIRQIKEKEYNFQKNYRQGIITNSEKEQYLKEESVKLQLIETQFLNEYTLHSNPEFHAQIQKDNLIRISNSTVSQTGDSLHQDIVLAKYDELLSKELEYVQKLVQEGEKGQTGVVLPAGTLINMAALVSIQGCLSNYQLVVDYQKQGVEKGKGPVIACLSREEFKQSLLAVDDIYVDKLLQFSETMPGFKEMSRTSAKKVLYQFTRIKIHKGWQMMSKSMMKIRDRKDKGSEPEDSSNVPSNKLYIILNGTFTYQSYKKNDSIQIKQQFQAQNNMTNSSGNAALSKFLRVTNPSNDLSSQADQLSFDLKNQGSKAKLGNQFQSTISSLPKKQITNHDRKIVEKQFQSAKNHLKFNQQKVKSILLSQGQVFGDDECLKTIFRMDDYPSGLIQSQHYSVTCQSNKAEILVASIDDIVKSIKNEPKVVHFLKQEYIDKYPSDFPKTRHFTEIFSTVQQRIKSDEVVKKMAEFKSSSSESPSENSSCLQSPEQAQTINLQSINTNQSPKSQFQREKNNSKSQKQIKKYVLQPTISFAIDKNFQKYGLEQKAQNLLLDKNETDFRTTIKEIVEDYPFTKNQRNDLVQSKINLSMLENYQNHSSMTNYNQNFLNEKLTTSDIARLPTRAASKIDQKEPLGSNYLFQNHGYQINNSDRPQMFLISGMDTEKQKMSQTTGFLNTNLNSGSSPKQLNQVIMSRNVLNASNSTGQFSNKPYMNSKIDQVLTNSFLSDKSRNLIQKGAQNISQSTTVLPLIPTAKKAMFQLHMYGNQTALKSNSQMQLDRLNQMQNPGYRNMVVAHTAHRGGKQKYKKPFDEEKTYDQLQVEAFMRKLRIRKEKQHILNIQKDIYQKIRVKGLEIFTRKKDEMEREKLKERQRKDALRNQLIKALKKGLQTNVDQSLKNEKQKQLVIKFQETLIDKIKRKRQDILEDETRKKLLTALRDTFVRKKQAQNKILDQIDPNELSAISLYLEKESVDFLQDKVAHFETSINDLKTKLTDLKVKLKNNSKYNEKLSDDALEINEENLNKKKWSFNIGNLEGDEVNQLTKCQHKSIDLDDNQGMIVNFYMLQIRQIISEKNKKLKELDGILIQSTMKWEQESITEEIEQIKTEYDEIIQGMRFVGDELGIQGCEVDVIKETLIMTDETGNKTTHYLHECFSQQETLKQLRMDEDGKENPLVYNFHNWGYLSNQFLAHNNYEMPSWRQVKRGIINEQIDIVREEQFQKMDGNLQQKMLSSIKQRAGRKGNVDQELQNKIRVILQLVAVKTQIWQARFSTIPIPNGDKNTHQDDSKPICECDFMDPYGGTNVSIFHLYSLNTFIYSNLNRYARNGDYEGGKNLAPFAAVLSKALETAGRYRIQKIDRSLTRTFHVYRGLTLDTKQLKQVKQMMGDYINLRGYTSTSLNQDVAIEFAMKYNIPERHPVLFSMNMRDGTLGGHCFLMNESIFSAYPSEEELLLDDGLPFKVITCRERKIDDRVLTVIVLECEMPQRPKLHTEGTFQSEFDLIDFMENNFQIPQTLSSARGKRPHYLSSFQSQVLDLVFGGKKQPLQRDNVPTQKSDLGLGMFAIVTTDYDHADSYIMENVTKYEDEFNDLGLKDVFLSHESYRLYNERKLRKPIQVDLQTKVSSVKRYLTVQPKFIADETLYQSTRNHLACLFPDPKRESLWLFQQIKCDATQANFIIMLKSWIWGRKDNSNKFDYLREYEEASYLAIKRLDQQSNDNIELIRNNESSYVYLTNQKNKAAVWTWKEVRNNIVLKSLEVPISLFQHMVSQQQWVLIPGGTRPEDILIFENLLHIHFESPSNEVKLIKAAEKKNDDKNDITLKHCNTSKSQHLLKWRFCSMQPEKIEVIIDNFDIADSSDQEPANHSCHHSIVMELFLKDQEYDHKGEMRVLGEHVSNDKIEGKKSPRKQQSNIGNNWFASPGDILLSVSRPEIKQLIAIEKSKLLSNIELRREIKHLMKSKGINLLNYLVRYQKDSINNIKCVHEPPDNCETPNEAELDPIAQDFHKICDGKPTFILIEGDQGQIFGGYTDIPWTSVGSVGKQTAWNNSFIFFRNDDKNEQKTMNYEDRYRIHKSKGTNEVYHSNRYGPNFIDLKILGPTANSEIMLDGIYQIKLADLNLEKNNIKGQRLFFQYNSIEVFQTVPLKNPKKDSDLSDE